MKVSELRDLNRSAYETAANGWRKVSNQARADMQVVDQQMSAKLVSFRGETKTASDKALMQLSRNFQYVQVQCGLIHTTLRSLAEDLATPQRSLKRALDDASESGLTVHDDGRVSYPKAAGNDGTPLPGGTVGGPGGPGGAAGDKATQPSVLNPTDEAALYRDGGRSGVNPKRGTAEQLATTISKALRNAERVDAQHSAALAKLAVKRGLNVSNAVWADSESDRDAVRKIADDNYEESDIPKSKSPTENVKWWDDLTAVERDAYITMYPAKVGALDGLPAEIRDIANRVVHREETASVSSALAKHEANEPQKSHQGPKGAAQTSEWLEWEVEHKRLEGNLSGLKDIDDRFERTGKEGLPEAYLLAISPENNGQAVIATGNPDTADRTSVYVPGTGSGLSGISGDLERSEDLWRTANAMTEKNEISSITWLGYDAPQGIVEDAPLSKYADDGAPGFSKFLDGLDASNTTESGGTRIAVGHSYGSTLIGSAARQEGLNADDVILVGSPGVQVGSAAEFGVPKGHVWNQEADGDSVPDLGRFAHGGHQLEYQGGTHIVPSDELFGAEQMATDTRGHSDYWQPGTRSILNQAAVVAGEYDRVHLEE